MKRLRLAVGSLLLCPAVAGCGGTTKADGSTGTGGEGGSPGCQASDRCVEVGGTAGTTSTGAASGVGASGGTATGGSAVSSGGVTGGFSGTGGESLCSNVTPCGGELVGTWTVTSSCLTVTGEVNLREMAIFCTAQVVTGSLEVSGTWTANGDGTHSDNTRTTGSHNLELGEDCTWFVSSTPISCERIGEALPVLGYAEATCVDNPATDGCTCNAVIDQPGPGRDQSGGIGFAPNPVMDPADSYATDDNALTIGEATYSYCASGTTLRLTPMSGTLEGSIELQRQ